MRIAADIEPDDLPEEQARTLLELLDDMDFNEIPEQLKSGGVPPVHLLHYSGNVKVAAHSRYR